MSKKKKLNQSYKKEERRLVMENLKNQTHYQIVLTQNSIIKKNTMIHQPKVKLQKRINNIYIYIERERERERERDNNYLFRERNRKENEKKKA